MSIFGTDYVYFPLLQPFRFVKQQYSYDEFFENSINAIEQQTTYCMKWEALDTITFQFRYLTSIADSVEVQLIDKYGNIHKTFKQFELYEDEDGWKYIHCLTYLQKRGGAVFPDGVYFIQLIFTCDSNTDNFISEPIYVKQTWDDTILLEYNHSSNDFDMIFQKLILDRKTEIEAGDENAYDLVKTAPMYKLRFEGGFFSNEFNPSSEDTIYNDYERNSTLLTSQPYNVWTLTIGDCGGVPNYMADKISRILSCEFVVIDKVYYTKDSGTIEKKQYDDKTAKGVWKVNLTNYENKYSDIYKLRMCKYGVGSYIVGNNTMVEVESTPPPVYEALLTISEINTKLDTLNGEVIQTTPVDKVDYAIATKEILITNLEAKGIVVTTQTLRELAGEILNIVSGSSVWEEWDNPII